MLWITVFVANAAVMVFEIIGARAMAPFVGSSSEVWSGVIAAVLGGMTIGYWGGGRLADKKPNAPWLGCALVAAGVTMFVPWAMRDQIFLLAPLLARMIPLTLAAFIVGLVFFAPAAIALGSVGPFAAKVAISSLAASARTVGRLSAVAAFGSVIGTIAVGAWLAPKFGNNAIVMTLSLVLTALGLASFGWKRLKGRIIGIIVILAFIFGYSAFFFEAPRVARRLVADVDTAYNRIWVYDVSINDRPARVIHTDPFGTQCGSFVSPRGTTSVEPIFEYMYDMDVGIQLGGTSTRALLVGGCNYSQPRWMLSRGVVEHIDVSEIDPGMTRVARDWFGLEDDSRLSILHQDGRSVMREAAPGTYDLILLDAFNSFSSVPFHLTTKEAMASIEKSLAPGGFVVANAISATRGSAAGFLESYVATLETSFPYVKAFAVHNYANVFLPQNIIIVASREPFELPEKFATNEIRVNRENALVLTDDYAPIESLTAPLREWALTRI
jgi:MFS family permease